MKESKYMNNLYFIPTINKNKYIILYQYSEIFEKDLYYKKDNIYSQFISLFKDSIKNLILNKIKIVILIIKKFYGCLLFK